MKILVANLGSTSFKYRLFDMDSQRQLARGGIERIGSPESRCDGPDRRLQAGSDGQGRRPRRGRPPLPGPTDRRRRTAASAMPRKCRPSPSRRSTAAATAACSGLRPTCSRRWRKCAAWPRRTIRPTSPPCACWPTSCRKFRWWPLSKRISMRRSRRTTGSMPFLTSGPNRSASAAGDSTGPATATSPGGRPSCSAARTCGSSPATWAVPVRCAPSATARAWPRRWA